MDEEQVSRRMVAGLVDAIRRFAPQVTPPVSIISFDIYPWHRYVAVSVLDAAAPEGERDEDDPAMWPLFEVVATRLHDIPDLAAAAELMADAYGSAPDDVPPPVGTLKRGSSAAEEIAERCFVLGAQALTSPAVHATLVGAGIEPHTLRVINVDDSERRNYVGR